MQGRKTERHYGILIFSLGFIILFQSIAIGRDSSRLEKPALTILLPFDANAAATEPPAAPAQRAAETGIIAASAQAAAPPAAAAASPATTREQAVAEAALPPGSVRQPATPQPVEDLSYTMVAGDTFYGVASQFGMSARDLASANGLVRPWAQTGTVLRIPRSAVTGETAPRLEPTVMSYQVRAGDTLASIAERFHLNSSTLMTDNRLFSGKDPAEGKLLRVRVPPVIEHRVKAGESLWNLSKTYEVSLSRLVETNNLALADLGEGQVIRIPVTNPAILDRLWRSAHPNARPDNGKYRYPVAGRITDRFGMRTHPIYQFRNFHKGVDIAAEAGTPIRSARAGVVEFAGVKAGYGRVVVVRHADGCRTWYGHCSRLLARTGMKVKAGDRLARVGSSGSATGPHVHFEIRRGDRAVNPMRYLRG